MKSLLIALAFCIVGTAARAQAATVQFDATPGTAVAAANGWTSVLYVNGTAFPMAHVCTASGAAVTCEAPLPNIIPALTANGSQRFEVSFVDAVLGVESPKSAPFLRDRPVAPINLRFK